jgi:hypothetical protein
LVKTFYGWRERQLADATLVLTSPAGQTYVPTPGSALLFPGLCAPVGGMPPPHTHHRIADSPDRAAMMPKRRRTRAQDRAHRVATERNHNRRRRQTAYQAAQHTPSPDDGPPPF